MRQCESHSDQRPARRGVGRVGQAVPYNGEDQIPGAAPSDSIFPDPELPRIAPDCKNSGNTGLLLVIASSRLGITVLSNKLKDHSHGVRDRGTV